MLAVEVISELRSRGATLKGDEEGRLRVRPASILTPELVAAIRQHKAAILERLEGAGTTVLTTPPESRATGEASDCSRLDCPCIDCSAPSPKYAKPIETTGEVLEMARDYFGLSPEDREDPLYPPPEGTGDPMVRKHTDKARYFAGARARELERRRRDGLPPWIRVVDGGGAA